MGFYSIYLLTSLIPLIAKAQISNLPSSSTLSISITPSLSITPIITPTFAVTTVTPATNTPIKACDSNPCQNSATCTNLTPSTTNYTCECTEGFEGDNCEDPLSSSQVDFTMVSIDVGSLKINAESPQVIKDLLIDPNNNVFKTACEHLKKLFMKSFRFERTFNVRKIICLSFFFASVHSNLIIKTPITETPTPIELKEAIMTGLTFVKSEVPEVIFSDDPLTVTDYDECNTTEGYCDDSAICTNLPGTFLCTCTDGFELIDKSICKKIDITDDRTGTLLAIIIPIVTAGLLLLALVILVYFKKRQRKKNTYHARKAQ